MGLYGWIVFQVLGFVPHGPCKPFSCFDFFDFFFAVYSPSHVLCTLINCNLCRLPGCDFSYHQPKAAAIFVFCCYRYIEFSELQLSAVQFLLLYYEICSRDEAAKKESQVFTFFHTEKRDIQKRLEFTQRRHILDSKSSMVLLCHIIVIFMSYTQLLQVFNFLYGKFKYLYI